MNPPSLWFTNRGNGLDKIKTSCELSIVKTDSLVSVSYIKRARYCIQVAACFILRKVATKALCCNG